MPDPRQLAKAIVREAEEQLAKNVNSMTREEKLQVLKRLSESGVLIVRGGVAIAAHALGVTRFTIYNYLDLLREREGYVAKG